MDFKTRIFSDIKTMILVEGVDLIIPFPRKDDQHAKSLEQFNKIEGFSSLIYVINKSKPMILRTAALNHVLTLLSDHQLYDLLIHCLEKD